MAKNPTLAQILANASDDTLRLNAFHRKQSGLVVASPKRDVGHRQQEIKATGSEHDEQVKLFRLANLYPELKYMFAIPNGGLRSKATAGKLKAEGVKSGVPDIFLPLAKRGYNGMFIEMKVNRNKPTENQNDWIEALAKAGYFCVVCWSADEAIENLLWYVEKE